MKSMKFAAAAAAAAVFAGAFAAPPAEAAKKRRLAVEQPTRTIYYTPAGRRVVIVRPRSYLDAGTEVKPGERKFSDYAYPPGYRAYPDQYDWKGSWSRMPLPGPFDVPGF